MLSVTPAIYVNIFSIIFAVIQLGYICRYNKQVIDIVHFLTRVGNPLHTVASNKYID